MWRKDLGMPRSVMTMVTWCSASGRFDQKSQLLSALRMPVLGSRLIAWLRSGNLSGSRRKKTGVLLPTRSQLPSSVVTLHSNGGKCAFGSKYRRMRARLGTAQAITATAHKLARVVYHFLHSKEP